MRTAFFASMLVIGVPAAAQEPLVIAPAMSVAIETVQRRLAQLSAALQKDSELLTVIRVERARVDQVLAAAGEPSSAIAPHPIIAAALRLDQNALYENRAELEGYSLRLADLMKGVTTRLDELKSSLQAEDQAANAAMNTLIAIVKALHAMRCQYRDCAGL